MKCPKCGAQQVQLFMSWACDVCDGKAAAKTSSAKGFLGLIRDDGREVFASDYKRLGVSYEISSGKIYVNSSERFADPACDWGCIHKVRLFVGDSAPQWIAEWPVTNPYHAWPGTNLYVGRMPAVEHVAVSS